MEQLIEENLLPFPLDLSPYDFVATNCHTADEEASDEKEKTWCQILCTMRLQCVSKILTPRKMLQKTCLIAKINLWTNSFHNMYDML